MSLSGRLFVLLVLPCHPLLSGRIDSTTWGSPMVNWTRRVGFLILFYFHLFRSDPMAGGVVALHDPISGVQRSPSLAVWGHECHLGPLTTIVLIHDCHLGPLYELITWCCVLKFYSEFVRCWMKFTAKQFFRMSYQWWKEDWTDKFLQPPWGP